MLDMQMVTGSSPMSPTIHRFGARLRYSIAHSGTIRRAQRFLTAYETHRLDIADASRVGQRRADGH